MVFPRPGAGAGIDEYDMVVPLKYRPQAQAVEEPHTPPQEATTSVVAAIAKPAATHATLAATVSNVATANNKYQFNGSQTSAYTARAYATQPTQLAATRATLPPHRVYNSTEARTPNTAQARCRTRNLAIWSCKVTCIKVVAGG